MESTGPLPEGVEVAAPEVDRQDGVRRRRRVSRSILFEGLATDDQRRRILEKVDARPPTEAQTWLALAAIHGRKGSGEGAIAALRKARCLLRTANPPGKLASEADRLAEDLTGDRAGAACDAATCRELGFVEAGRGRSAFERDVGLDDVVHLFAIRRDGDLETLTVRVVGGKGALGPQIEYVHSLAGFRTCTSGPTRHAETLDSRVRVDVTARALDGAARFHLSFQVVSLHDRAARPESPEEDS